MVLDLEGIENFQAQLALRSDDELVEDLKTVVEERKNILKSEPYGKLLDIEIQSMTFELLRREFE